VIKKLLWLSIFLPAIVFSEGSRLQHKDSTIQQEFDWVYNAIGTILTKDGGSKCIDDPTFCVDTVNDKVDILELDVSTATFNEVTVSTLTATKIFVGTNTAGDLKARIRVVDDNFSGSSLLDLEQTDSTISAVRILNRTFSENLSNAWKFWQDNDGTLEYSGPDGVSQFNIKEGTVTIPGRVLIPDGTVAVPSIGFIGAEGTGMLRHPSDHLRFVVNGKLGFAISPTQTNMYAGGSDTLIGYTDAGGFKGIIYGTPENPFYSWSNDSDTGMTRPAAVNTLTFSVAGSTAININASGAITQPKQPSFLAKSNATQSNITGSAELVTIRFASEIYDTGSNFVVSTFTAPVDGFYSASAVLMIGGMDANCDRANVRFVTSNRTYAFENALDNDYSFDGAAISLDVIDMDANDTAYLQIRVSNCAGTTIDVNSGGNDTYFSMTLIN